MRQPAVQDHDKRLERAYAAAEEAIRKNEDFIHAFRQEYYRGMHFTRRQDEGWSEPKLEEKEPILDDPRFRENAKEVLLATLYNPKIIGGYEIGPFDLMDCVALGNAGGYYGATGVLIAPNAVLTAAHIGSFRSVVYIGSDISSRQGYEVGVARAVPHPDFDSSKMVHDLMVLILRQEVPNVVPRSMADSATIDQARQARVAGFGHTDRNGRTGYGKKRAALVPLASADCTAVIGGKPDAQVYHCHPGRELVAGRPNLGVDSCIGDSGGPLYITDQHGFSHLGGITSRKTAAAKWACGDGGIYVRVDRYYGWIQASLQTYA